MSILSAGEFLGECRRQGLQPHPEIAFDGRPMTLYSVYDPTGVFDLLWHAARLRRKDPEQRLAKGGLLGRRKTLDLEPFAADVAATALAQLINDSASPRQVDASARNFRTPASIQSIGACNGIETNFGELLSDLSAGNPATCEVYVDEDGKPVFLRKGEPGITVALSLEPVSNNGAAHNSFSVFRLDAKGDTQTTAADIAMPEGVHVRPLSDVTGLAYARPTAYGMSEQELAARFPFLERPLPYDEVSIRAQVVRAAGSAIAL